MRRNPAQD